MIITEASKSGYHDFLRALKLTQHFKVKTFVCVNKWDINPKISDQIEQDAVKNGATVLLKIPYDKDFKSSLIKGETIIGTNSKSAEIIKDIIKKIKEQ
ncbi:MAG: hypothetical protein BWY78_00563 [Alphaproteobacteria bacterium ADurb.Bin438]|nr:MAG: hypothetical protein BWY78_00563 [Alphaproteobacteria bacterium ADurb.Bin438]